MSWWSDFSRPQEESRLQDFSTPSNFQYPAELNKREGVSDQLHSHDRKLGALSSPSSLCSFCGMRTQTGRGCSSMRLHHAVSFSHPDCPSHPLPPSSVPPSSARGLSGAQPGPRFPAAKGPAERPHPSMSSGPQLQGWHLLLTCLKQTSTAVTDLKKLLYIQQHSCGQRTLKKWEVARQASKSNYPLIWDWATAEKHSTGHAPRPTVLFSSLLHIYNQIPPPLSLRSRHTEKCVHIKLTQKHTSQRHRLRNIDN